MSAGKAAVPNAEARSTHTERVGAHLAPGPGPLCGQPWPHGPGGKAPPRLSAGPGPQAHVSADTAAQTSHSHSCSWTTKPRGQRGRGESIHTLLPTRQRVARSGGTETQPCAPWVPVSFGNSEQDGNLQTVARPSLITTETCCACSVQVLRPGTAHGPALNSAPGTPSTLGSSPDQLL